ncbi:3-hydroxyisobutyrate dehydrogenase [Paraburkholderia sp. BCC1886]|uniref:3-hydroxyisobutyrate dehydrogenase n=1 Tax=Paraburkholderia sp. BCC1886 TaxID=2562670 RepID=UPI0011829FF4|nr:3-hydroxyisobutyrate dehydrogenase [Paraburkholderia sp. BCC1886]
MKIGFIGLGNMGAPMAHNLLKAGHALSVFDLDAKAVQALVDAGATAAASPKAAATDAQCVITMLPAAAHVRHVLTADDGVLAGLGDGVTVIDSSTIDPASVKAFAELAGRQGSAFVDAPVSGGTGGAQAGTLTFMVGGSASTFEQVKPVLSAMGKNIVHCGDTGTGQVAKICNNLVLGITMAGVAEAMSLGEALGIDANVLGGIINTSTGRCWSSDTCNPMPGVIGTAPSSRGYTGGFGTDLMLKDLGLATDAAKSARRPVYLGALAQQLYQTMSTQGAGRLDFSAVIKLYRNDGKEGGV